MDKADGGRKAVRPVFFAIMLGPMLLFVLNQAVIQGIGVPSLPVDAGILRDDWQYLEALGRNRFLAGVMFFTVIVAVSLVFFATELGGRLTWATRAWALLSFAAVQALVLQSVIDHQTGGGDVFRSYHQLGEGVMAEVLSHGTVPVCEAGDRMLLFWDCGANPVLTLFETLLDYMNVLSALGVGGLVLGMILCLALPVGQADLALRAHAMARAQLASRRFLYMAGLLLSAGMFVTISWMHWPVPLIEGAQQSAYREAIDGTLFYYGVFYTLLIMLGFGPVIFVQARRIDALAMEALVTAEPKRIPSVPELEKWKAANGLTVSMVQSLQALVAAGAPMMTGFAGSFAPI